MIEPLQRFGFKESPYERPNARWRCGREDQGQACSLGPQRRGRCPGATCQPIRRDGKWACGRPDHKGAACSSGPTQFGACSLPIPPCQPKMTHRTRRGLWTRWVLMLTVAALMGLLAHADLRRAVVIPGELSRPHAPLARDCTTCHTGADQGPSGWLQASLSANRAELDSQRCNACHQLGSVLLPHSLAEVQLAELAAKAAQRGPGEPGALLNLASGLRELQAANKEIACATCHREHQGRYADLTLLPDRNCQICHTNQFVSLAEGHPEFTDFGAEHAGLLKFTHSRHLREGGHFNKQERAAPACSECHRADTEGEHYPVRSFQAMCSSCHADSLDGRKLTFFQLPGAPIVSLEKAGEWPALIHDTEQLQFSYIDATESSPSAFSLALLAGDPEGREPVSLQALRDIANGSLEGEALDPARVEAGRAWVWAVKGLFAELAAASPQDEARLVARLERLTGRSLTPDEVAPFLAALPQEGLRKARELWLPHSDTEQPGADSQILFEGKVWDGEDEGSGEWRPQAKESIQQALPQGWRVGDAFDIQYEVRGHADPLLRAWLELAASLPRGSPALKPFLAAEQGLCTSCHRVEETSVGVQVHWRVANATGREQGHTRFPHTPHDRFAGIVGCQSCHQLTEPRLPEDAENPALLAAEYSGSDFELVDYATRERCASCHTPDRAGDSCLSCHDYHIGFIPLPHEPDPETWEED